MKSHAKLTSMKEKFSSGSIDFYSFLRSSRRFLQSCYQGLTWEYSRRDRSRNQLWYCIVVRAMKI